MLGHNNENHTHSLKKHLDPSVIQQLFNTVIISSLLVFMEWIFLVTKPSFLSTVNWGQKIAILFRSMAIFNAIIIFVMGLVFFVSLAFNEKWKKNVLILSNILPAFIMAILIILMIDNFTYTVFNIGIVNLMGYPRGGYLLFFLFLIYNRFKFFKTLVSKDDFKYTTGKFIFLGVVSLTAIFVALSIILSFQKPENGSISTSNNQLPNIILIGSDGLNSNHMSVYGYQRDTTPNITAFSKDSLIVQNSFTNSGDTSGSLISIFTSKFPTQTRVLYPPDMLSGSDAVEHLPGILKQLGYYNIQLSTPHFADAYTLGMINGFDRVNQIYAEKDSYLWLITKGFATNDAYFLSSTFDRISDRVLHLFFVKRMANYYEMMMQNEVVEPDRNKILSVLSLVDASRTQPLFFNVHVMATHGPFFYPQRSLFSAGQDQSERWMTDFYDDSILYFDDLFGELVEGLKENGTYENTIIIIYTDHAQGHIAIDRIPLIIRFPNGEYSRKEINFAQNLDIAPTILDYLEVEIPEWMNGSSLIDPAFSSQPVISVRTSSKINKEFTGMVLDKEYLNPPFYQFDIISVVDCQRYFEIDLNDFTYKQGDVIGFYEPCEEHNLLTLEHALDVLSERLSTDGFDIPQEFKDILK